jgi:chromosome segregation ATPase
MKAINIPYDSFDFSNLSEDDQKEYHKKNADFEKQIKVLHEKIQNANNKTFELEKQMDVLEGQARENRHCFRQKACAVIERKEIQKEIQQQTHIITSVMDNIFTHLQTKSPEVAKLVEFLKNLKDNLTKDVTTN